MGTGMKEDEYDCMGKTIAKKLRGIGQKDRRAYLELEFKITGLLHEAEIAQLE